MVAASELSINTNVTAAEMANSMFGSGVTIVNATYTGATSASGIYYGGSTTTPGVAPLDTGVILSTGRATDFTNSSGTANQSASTTTSQGTAGDAQLTAIAGFQTYDAAILTSTFIPDGNVLTMQVTFSSEEYLEYVGSGFNDAVAIWVNGTQAQLTVGTGDITINNINTTSNSNLFVNNPSATSPYNTEMDGFTVTLTLKAPVIAGAENTIKIAIADAGDRSYDSNLMIAGDSIQVALIAGDDSIELPMFGTGTLNVLVNDSSVVGGTLTITQINGVDVVAGDAVTLPTGEVVTLNVDGTFDITADAGVGVNTFTYTVEDVDGNSDVAFVTVDTVPCFTRGTLILTQRGEIAIEKLTLGDKVITRDHGLQPVRWIGNRPVPKSGACAPVIIAAGTFGNHDELVVSPQHRILIRTTQAQLIMATEEVLVKALHLVNGTSVRRDTSGGMVDYFHILFDMHEVIWSNGLETESFHPGANVLGDMDVEARQEILDLFPELDPVTGQGYGPAARPDIKSHEARALFAT